MKKKSSFDLSVYFIADPSLCAGRNVVDVVKAAAAGGATMVQLRNKSGNILELLEQAHKCRAVLRPLGIPFIINDRADVAHEINADGVHLGQDDMHPEAARKILGEGKIIGVTAYDVPHFEAIDPSVVSYAGTGPFYPTKTDKGKPVLGPEKFCELVRSSPVPVVGVGGITPENAFRIIESGGAGVAMMRAVSEADHPELVIREFIRKIKMVEDEEGDSLQKGAGGAG